MFKQLALKYIKRNKKTSIIFITLNLLVVLILAVSLTLSSTLNHALKTMEEDFSTIGVVEYIGENYPNVYASVDPEIKDKTIEFKELIQATDYKYYDETSNIFAYVESDTAFNKNALNNAAIVKVTVSHYNENLGMYYCYCDEAIYSQEKVENTLILVDSVEMELQDKGHYLIHGEYFYSGPYIAIGAKEFDLYDYEENTSIVNLDEVTIDENSVFYRIAETYQMISRSLTFISNEHIEDLIEFNQAYLTLSQGKMPEKNECILSERIASLLGKEVGDTLSISLMNKESTLVRRMFNLEDDFNLEKEYVISGLFIENREYDYCLYANDDLNLSSYNDYHIGNLRISNGMISEYTESLELPSYYHITFYDQGYGAIRDSLDTMMNMIGIIVMIAFVVSVVFVIMDCYLLLSIQNRVPLNMVRLGTSRKEIHQYYLWMNGIISLCTSIISTVLGSIVSSQIFKYLLNEVNNGNNSSLLFSNSSASIRKTLVYNSSINIGLIVLIPVLYTLFNLMMTTLFTERALNQSKQKKQEKRFLKTRSHKLTGLFKYSRLSMLRNGFKTLVPVILFCVLSVLYNQLPKAIENTRSQLEEFKETQLITAYFTDYYGSQYDNLVIDDNVIQRISNQENIYNISYSRSGVYNLINVIKKDGTVTGPGLKKQPIGSYAQETYIEELLRSNKFKTTNDIYGAGEFIYSKDSLIVEWLDGYSNADLKENKSKENICVISKKLAEDNNAELGDDVVIEMLYQGSTMSEIRYLKLKIIGIYSDDGVNNTIYTFSDMIHATKDETVQNTELEFCLGLRVETYSQIYGHNRKAYSYQSATFEVNGANLQKVKDELYAAAYSEPNHIRTLRDFILFNDTNYLNTEKSFTQKIWYMEYLFPIIYIAGLVLSFVLGYQAIKSRRKELVIMHNLGTSFKDMFTNIYAEQIILAVFGLIISWGILNVLRNSSLLTYILLGCTFVLYLAGALYSFKTATVFNRKNTRGDL